MDPFYDYDSMETGTNQSSQSNTNNTSQNNSSNNGTSAGVAYIIWLIILIILIWVLRTYGVRWFSTIVVALVISVIILCLIYPFHMEDSHYFFKSEDSLFGLIWLITIILVVIYIIYMASHDREQLDSCVNLAWWGKADKGKSDCFSS